MVELNKKAPDFAIPSSDGKLFSLSDYQGRKNVVLIIYPGDDTPGCTTQLNSASNSYKEFGDADTVIVGVNHADAKSHNKFIQKHKLKVPLLVDKNRSVIKAYDATRTFFGVTTTKRSVFIIDKQGIVRYIKYGMPSDEELLEQLQRINHTN